MQCTALQCNATSTTTNQVTADVRTYFSVIITKTRSFLLFDMNKLKMNQSHPSIQLPPPSLPLHKRRKPCRNEGKIRFSLSGDCRCTDAGWLRNEWMQDSVEYAYTHIYIHASLILRSTRGVVIQGMKYKVLRREYRVRSWRLGKTAGFLEDGPVLGLPLLSLESSTSPSHPSNP